MERIWENNKYGYLIPNENQKTLTFEGDAQVAPDEKSRKATTGENMAEAEQKGRRPDFRAVQPGTDADGKPTFTNVGAIWMNATGKSAGILKIGDLRLILFKNEPKAK